jgi:hypothetical protein
MDTFIMKKPTIYNSKNIDFLHCFTRIPLKEGVLEKAHESISMKLKDFVSAKKGQVAQITSKSKELQVYLILPLTTSKETISEELYKLVEEYADGVPTTMMIAK